MPNGCLNGAYALALGCALDRAQLPAHAYEFNAALARALERPDAEQALLAREDIFAGVRVNRKRPVLPGRSYRSRRHPPNLWTVPLTTHPAEAVAGESRGLLSGREASIRRLTRNNKRSRMRRPFALSA